MKWGHGHRLIGAFIINNKMKGYSEEYDEQFQVYMGSKGRVYLIQSVKILTRHHIREELCHKTGFNFIMKGHYSQVFQL